MADQFLPGIVTASIMVFLLLIRFRGCRQKAHLAPGNGSSRSILAGKGGTGTGVIIVGAGVAGSALAYMLGKDGRRVHVIERDLSEPDRIVGEILHPGGYLKLLELGLEDCVDEIDAQRVVGYALFKDRKSTRLTYPLEKHHEDVAGRSFRNGLNIVRVSLLRSMDHESFFQCSVGAGNSHFLIEKNGSIEGVVYKTNSGEEQREAYAPLTIVCDGAFSNLRRTLCSPKIVSFHFPTTAHIILGDPSIILFYPISSTEVRCLVDVPGNKIPSVATGEMSNFLKTTVAPQVPTELHDPFIEAIDKGSFRSVPNKSMPAAPHPTPGALLLGDAFNMRHSLTGGGMTVGLSDIVVLRDLLRPIPDLHHAASLCKYLESFYTLRKVPMASTINTLAYALYKIFRASSDRGRSEMRQACFDYLSIVGVYSNGPIRLLSGLNPRPMSLMAHFLAIVIYGVGQLLLPFPSLENLWIGARLICAEGIRQMFFPATVPAYYRGVRKLNDLVYALNSGSRLYASAVLLMG
ncbi:hypothetical protein ZIOFF_020855 [Zingiber officinale]|uniref:Squalene monooxygenase n=1 Tax=Zingiber officinale TaxID=94328 RepID=A0A8J5H2Z8_ZINOF|nr:hypothetical protein ZIOFF_020855 [Zingiber officinale]